MLTKIINKISAEINPISIYLFGSYATDTFNNDSDLDLIIEVDDSKSIFDIKKQINRVLFDRDISIDILVEKTSDLQKNKLNSASFYFSIKESIKKVYEHN